MGQIITVKVNKGGVGKTFVTMQVGSLLAIEGKKVLILTSDSQNNILDYAFGAGRRVEFDKGLKEFVKGKVGEIINLRENLFFIPLESNTFSNQFFNELPNFLHKIREDYDFILIDSIPTMKLDTIFIQNTDKLIIPCFSDNVTVNGAINVIKECGVDKVLAVVVNKYNNKRIQNLFLNQIRESVEGTSIIFPEPIKDSSDIEELLYKGKTLWESNKKGLIGAKDSIKLVVEGIIGETVYQDVNNFDTDFDIEF